MINIERILCPLDLSKESAKALRYAAALASAYKAKLYICYCEGEFATSDSAAHPATSKNIESMIERSIELYMTREGASMPEWDSIVAHSDDPAVAIAREAAARSIDLVVMNSRRRPLRAAVLGSIAEAVCRIAPCPVLVTHPDQREWIEEMTSTVNLKRIMVAHDFSDYSELALKYALSLAQEYQAELHLLHVLTPPLLREPELDWHGSANGPYHDAARKLHAAVSRETYLWCEVKTAVRWGRPYQEILSFANEREIDLILMGAHGAGFSKQALFGSNVDRVMRQSPCPLLVARPLRPSMFMPFDVQSYS